MELPPELRPVLDALRRVARPRLAGGCVRDALLGLSPKDFDVEVQGITFDALQSVLAPFGATDVVGRSFGVIKLRLKGAEYDFSLPRRESKTGSGHRGFAVTPDPLLSDADAAARRDFTINSLTCDPFTGEIFDPHGGQRDLRDRVLRHTSPAFAEDPLRVLRAFQFAARFNLTLAPETAALCRSIADTYRELPVERVWGEWDKWATQATCPSRGLAVLEETGWLVHFPEIATLRGCPQDPEWHPEGDVLTHTAHCCDALVKQPDWVNSPPARRRILLLAVLAHDFGKPATTAQSEVRGRLRWRSLGHESAGGPLADTFLRRIGAPHAVLDAVRPLVVLHLAHHHGSGEFSDSHIRRLARKLHPATIDDLCAVMIADSLGRPPLSGTESLPLIETLRKRAHELNLRQNPPRPILLGRHLIHLGHTPGPQFSAILHAGFEAQLDGDFTDAEGALIWLRNYLQKIPHPES
ncbi:MAG: polynucleotide adenylyltransferase [Opitutus sp.]|nr:polynucleotide adenylyltransferase [Opitutus sp.]MCS6247985.1 polynucleotide adenylyltransferase [Opitutus sp.]MCS6274555.1 polynucleotide adenylyltransferase [Opitutus sp.]MCS6299842.1 polynucleotide adenylyltransferase [Opitutus sp.]